MTMLKRKEFILGAAVGLTFAAAATAGGVISWPTANAQVAGVSGQIAPTAGAAGLAFAPPQGAPLSFADIFDQVSPAVVQITVETTVQRPRTGRMQIPGLPPGFGFQLPESEQGAEPRTSTGAGSGFFVSANGFIVTNNHVVENATEISVTLADGRELEAKLVGRDPATDLAVIKVEGDAFPFVSFEQGAQPRVGDWVIAVGNPFGLGGTATAGIVSATARQNVDRSTSQYVDFLQIDAAINTGNSGGPTFDIYGRVIGVNSAILSPSGGSVGIGFAIPASIAKNVTDQLIEGGAVKRGYVGLGLNTFNDDQWEAYGQPRDFEGAYVGSVTPGAPADRAGAEVGDLLVAVNGEPVSDGTEATRLVAATRPGETVRLEVIRDGRRQTLNVRAAVRPSEAELLAADGAGAEEPATVQPPAASGEAIEGISVAPLSAATRSRFNVPETVTGVVIVAVAADTPAAELGLRPGDIITRANAQAVTSVTELRDVVASVKRAGRPSVLLFVRRGAGPAAPLPLKFAAAE